MDGCAEMTANSAAHPDAREAPRSIKRYRPRAGGCER
jgi:hypothetical protein